MCCRVITCNDYCMWRSFLAMTYKVCCVCLGVPLLFRRGAPLFVRVLFVVGPVLPPVRPRGGRVGFLLAPGFLRFFLWGFPMSSSFSFVRAAAPVVSFVPFAPSSLSLGRAGSVPASRFVPVASGVVVSVGWCPRRSGLLVSLASGASFCCLVSGLPGGFAGPAAVALAASLRSARASGAVVSVLGAPGSRGSVCPGFFCGLAPAPVFRSARA